MDLLWWQNGDEQTLRWIVELRLQSRYYKRMKHYYLNKAVQAAKSGDTTLARMYEEQAVAHEKSRILTLNNLRRIERALEESRLAKGMQKTADIVKEAEKKLNREKVKKTVVKAVTVMTSVEAEDQIIPEAMDIALQEGQINPEEARRIIHNELEAKLREEMGPEVEAERIREEIQKEAQKEGA